MDKIIARDLQLARPHTKMLREECLKVDINPYELTALILRESRFGTCPGYEPRNGTADGWGDRGHAYGWFQIDKRYHAKFLQRKDRADPRVQCAYALKLLTDNRKILTSSVPHATEAARHQAMFSGYNASLRKVVAQLHLRQDPDSVTTGKDYGKWILNKSQNLYLADPTLFDVK